MVCYGILPLSQVVQDDKYCVASFKKPCDQDFKISIGILELAIGWHSRILVAGGGGTYGCLLRLLAIASGDCVAIVGC